MSLAFPNVPNLPGVPQLVRAAGALLSTQVVIGVAQITNILAAASQTQNVWGVFEAGTAPVSQSGFNLGALAGISASANLIAGFASSNPNNNGAVIQPDSIREFGTRAEWRVSNFPVQRGSFASYNKVTLPAEYYVRMVKGGPVSARQQFQAQVEAAAATLDLYTIITPEQSFTDCNITRYEITRKGAGDAYFIEVDLYFQQIIQVNAQYSTTDPGATDTSNALSPSAVPNASQGTVSGVPSVSPLVASPLASVGIQ